MKTCVYEQVFQQHRGKERHKINIQKRIAFKCKQGITQKINKESNNVIPFIVTKLVHRRLKGNGDMLSKWLKPSVLR